MNCQVLLDGCLWFQLSLSEEILNIQADVLLGRLSAIGVGLNSTCLCCHRYPNLLQLEPVFADIHIGPPSRIETRALPDPARRVEIDRPT